MTIQTASEALDILTPAQAEWMWVVIHTKPRCEKKVQALQAQRPADFFLPCIERVHNYGSRMRKYEIPMFTGYVFAKIRIEDKNWFRQNNNVANIIPVLDESKLLEPLRAVATALSTGTEMEVLPFLKPGQFVKITGGPMKGLEAEITEVKGKKLIVLKIEMIQQSVALEIEPAYVKAIT
jgi:transcription antitermination factor NusG